MQRISLRGKSIGKLPGRAGLDRPHRRCAVNAVNRRGVHRVVFGMATEAWAEQGSFAMLTGIEATTINREPDNPWQKISLWSTFKNRPDTEYWTALSDPDNMGSQALRIESQPGTGFERGIVCSNRIAPFANTAEAGGNRLVGD